MRTSVVILLELAGIGCIAGAMFTVFDRPLRGLAYAAGFVVSQAILGLVRK